MNSQTYLDRVAYIKIDTSGPAGIGKSRATHELLKNAQERLGDWAEVHVLYDMRLDVPHEAPCRKRTLEIRARELWDLATANHKSPVLIHIMGA